MTKKDITRERERERERERLFETRIDLRVCEDEKRRDYDKCMREKKTRKVNLSKNKVREKEEEREGKFNQETSVFGRK